MHDSGDAVEGSNRDVLSHRIAAMGWSWKGAKGKSAGGGTSGGKGWRSGSKGARGVRKAGMN